MNKLFLFFLMFCYTLLHSQNKIFSDLSVMIGEQPNKGILKDDAKVNYAFFYAFPIAVTQTVFLDNYDRDTLKLSLQNISVYNNVLSSLFFHNLVVISPNGQSKDTINYQFDGTNLLIPFKSSYREISIQYEYQSDYFFKSNIPGANIEYFFQPQMFFWHSWYFTNPELWLSNVMFNVPTNEALFFADFSKQTDINHFEADIKKIKTEYGISFYLLNRKFYKEDSFFVNSTHVNLFFTTGVRIDSTNVIRDNQERILYNLFPKSTIDQNKINLINSRINSSLIKIEKIFNKKDSININIADSYLELKDEEGTKFVWGNVTQCSDNSYLILIDTSMWQSHDLIHEIIHIHSGIEPAMHNDDYYFFHESMIEYLAVYLGYNSENKRDSVFNRHLKQFNEIKTDDLDATSIFDVKYNGYRLDGSSGGTSGVVYQKTPYKIHQLAKSIGEEKFIRILTKFYYNVKKTQTCSFYNFEKTLKKNGVTNKQWADFMKGL